MKMRHKEKCRAGKCRNRKYGTKLQGWKMRDWKMWHKNAGRENAGLENTAQEILGWKMRVKSVRKAKLYIAYNGSAFIGTIKSNTSYIFRTTV